MNPVDAAIIVVYLLGMVGVGAWFIGFSGLVLAAVAAATMSTLSANLNSAATAVTTDFYQRLVVGRSPSRTKEDYAPNLLLCGRIVTIVVGLLGGAFALVLANMDIGSIYDQFLKFLGVLTGGLTCLFLMGRFLPFANKPHLLLYGFFGMVACLIVAPLVSLCFREGK